MIEWTTFMRFQWFFPTTFQEPAIFRDRESDDYGEDCVIYSRHPLLFVGSRDRKTSCVHVWCKYMHTYVKYTCIYTYGITFKYVNGPFSKVSKIAFSQSQSSERGGGKKMSNIDLHLIHSSSTQIQGGMFWCTQIP